jgi:hypothetical protein
MVLLRQLSPLVKALLLLKPHILFSIYLFLVLLMLIILSLLLKSILKAPRTT